MNQTTSALPNVRKQELFKIWDTLRPSVPKELEELKTKAYDDTKKLLETQPDTAHEVLKKLVDYMSIRKIAYDMYVWQRIEAIELGIDEALKVEL